MQRVSLCSLGTAFDDQLSIKWCQLESVISNQNICRALVNQVVKNKDLYFREYSYFTWYDFS